MGQSIQEWTKRNLWKKAFKKFEGIWKFHVYVYIPCQYDLKFPAKCASASQENAPGRSSITTSFQGQ